MDVNGHEWTYTHAGWRRSLLSEVRTHYRDPSKAFPGGDDSTLLYDITPYLESAGISDPVTKVCVWGGECGVCVGGWGECGVCMC